MQAFLKNVEVPLAGAAMPSDGTLQAALPPGQCPRNAGEGIPLQAPPVEAHNVSTIRLSRGTKSEVPQNQRFLFYTIYIV